MIIFKKVRWTNFLSTGNNPVEILLDKSTTSLIIGENGSGKSTILDALCFALYGKPFRNINKPQLVNSTNERGTLVELEFSIGTNYYQVTRGIKPNIFEIKCNQKLINQDSHSRDYQEYLEKTILQFNYKSFTQVVILGSASFTPFMQLKLTDRRNIIESLLDIQIFSLMNNLLKERVSENKNELDDLAIQKDKVNHQIVVQNEYITSLEKDNQKSIEENQKKIDDSNIQIETYNKDNEIIQQSTNSLIESVKDSNKINARKKKLDILKEKVQDSIQSKEHEIHFYEENTDCPTCKQSIDELFRSEQIKTKKNKVGEQQSGLKELITELETTQTKIDEVSIQLEQISDFQSKISKNTNSILGIQKYIEKIKDELSKLSLTGNIKEQRKKLVDYQNNLNKYEEEVKGLFTVKEVHEVATSLLKDGGIKSRIIKTYLPIINTYIQRNLTALDFYVSFNLDENFNETIKSRFRDDFTYSSFSEGEKMRIDLALLFAWRQVAKIKNSMNTNLLILDEVFDSSLDAAGTDEFLKLINGLDKNINTFVISHKGESLYEKFKHMIKFEKKNYFSRIVDYEHPTIS